MQHEALKLCILLQESFILVGEVIARIDTTGAASADSDTHRLSSCRVHGHLATLDLQN